MYRVSLNTQSKRFFCGIILFGCVLQVIISICGFWYAEYAKIKNLEVSPFRDMDPTNNYMDVCSLPIYDYWHPDVMKNFDPNYDPHKECDKEFKPFTKLVNGNWSIVEEKKGSNCSARCFYNIDDWNVKITDWFKPGPVDCEFLEAVCWEKDVEVYGNIHTQVIPKNSTVPPTNNTTPSVFVFLFDSMSVGQAKRQFNKTLSILSNRLESVEFPFLNKVGENSRPNGIALWFGKLFENVNGESFGGLNFERESEESAYCNQWLNESIFADYEKKGYMTLAIDDWMLQMVNWPNCYGFEDAPTHHYMHPFFMIYEKKGTNITKKHLDGHLCKEERHAVFKYFQEFVDAYKEKPQFTFSWISTPAHDLLSGFYRVDHEMADLLEKNMKKFDNSFVIFMGDHGYRTGGFHRSEIGRFEKNNPYFSISIPQNLRKKSGILEVLRENSKKLQTHFDVRSTLLDIVRYQPESKFTNRSVHEVDGERGHSFLRHQPDSPRTCGRLPIPPDYCICQVDKVPIYDENIRERFRFRLIDHIHLTMDKANFSHMCDRFGFKKVTSLLHYGHLNQTKPTHNYDLTVKAGWPSFAIFQTTIAHNRETDEINFGTITRLDRYGTMGSCTKSNIYEKLCYCKENYKWSTVFSRIFDMF